MGLKVAHWATTHPVLNAIHESVHAVQFYETDGYLVESIAGYVAFGLGKGEASIVIATPEHRRALETRLSMLGIDVPKAVRGGTYVPMDAAATISLITRDGAIDASRFTEVVGGAIVRAQGENGESRPVRAFGEMVALLWARGDQTATLTLEHLWDELAKTLRFALICAYPTHLFRGDGAPSAEISEVASLHAKGTTLSS